MKWFFHPEGISALGNSRWELCILVLISPLLFAITLLVLALSLLLFSADEFIRKRRQARRFVPSA